ncbi:MAG: response regulator [Bacteroidales bacterium]|nr:response regulator [Bacteroidales bacterium]
MPKILIIDDDHHVLLMIKKMLERAGYTVDLASNGNNGLELFKRIPADLVITDIIMPEKEGLETIREMKRMQPDLKIIAMSGGGKISADNYLGTAKIFGASRILEKPFSQKVMLETVNELLGVSSEKKINMDQESSEKGLDKKQRREQGGGNHNNPVDLFR